MLTSPMGLSVSQTYAHSVDGICQNRVRRLQISWPLQTEDAPELTLDSSSAPGTRVTGAGVECLKHPHQLCFADRRQARDMDGARTELAIERSRPVLRAFRGRLRRTIQGRDSSHSRVLPQTRPYAHPEPGKSHSSYRQSRF